MKETHIIDGDDTLKNYPIMLTSHVTIANAKTSN